MRYDGDDDSRDVKMLKQAVGGDELVEVEGGGRTRLNLFGLGGRVSPGSVGGYWCFKPSEGAGNTEKHLVNCGL